MSSSLAKTSLRSHYCGQVDTDLIGEYVSLCGWVLRHRDHGGVIFIDLRDREGLVQVVCNPEQDAVFQLAESLCNEFCIRVKGWVRARPEGTINLDLASGAIEVVASELEIFNAATTPPFMLDYKHISESVRLAHRVLDLRRSTMQAHIRLRYRLSFAVRQFLDAHGFLDIETPMLTKATPEGARDYLVPSRIHAGAFFALPQSPQLFKQMIMMAGFDRYYQITKCFRDEDLRADRQPEFTQIDCETSFMNETEIRVLFEDMVYTVFAQVIEVNLSRPFTVMPYAEAMARFGSDKPDLRVQLELVDITEVVKNVAFKVFSQPANSDGGRVVVMRIPQGGRDSDGLTRSEIDNYTDFVRLYGAKGLAYIKVNARDKGRDGLQSPIIKNIDDDVLAEILSHSGAQDGDLLFFGAGRAKVVNDAMGALRVRIGRSDWGRRNSLFKEGWFPLWVVNFPLLEWDEEARRWVACHHPFTAPKKEHMQWLSSNPEKCAAQAYDLVLNGWEIGGGSVRIHDAQLQREIFHILNIKDDEANQKFGFLLEALRYGTPPHGGIAFGLDRMAALMCNLDSIREVIAFPKTQRAQCLLTQAPSAIDEEHLRELHIKSHNPTLS